MNSTARTDVANRVPAGLFIVGLIAALAGVAASAMLVAEHLFGAHLPGCGPQSDCAKLSAGAWGRMPGLGWPVSFLGLAYFLAATVGWLTSGGGVSRALRALVWLGAIASAMFLVAMVIEGAWCWYCVAAHAADFLLLACVEVAARRAGPAPVRGGRLAGMAAAFVAVIAATVSLDAQREARAAQYAEAELAESQQRIIDAAEAQRVAFTGRYVHGPERAPIRIVVFSDYQCVDCNRVEEELRAIIETRDDVSLSMKHFPMSSKCNPHLGRDMHPNACWAARAAEAAGMLRGEDGFWQMHFWLFDRNGGFTDAELAAGLREMDYDVQSFLDVMTGGETLQRVQADIEEGARLGLYFTPMIFINGVEMKGWQVPGAVTRAVEAVAKENPPALTAAEAGDVPPTADEKFVDDWLAARQRPVSATPAARTLGGPDDAPLRIVVWGDYSVPGTLEVDREVQRWALARDDVRYEYRYFPVDEACNPAVSTTRSDYGCRSARAAEAAAAVGGADAFRSMHVWLLDHADQQPGRDEILDAAVQMGLDRRAFAGAMDADAVLDAIVDDAMDARAMGVRSVPMVVVNGRVLQRFKVADDMKLHLLYEHVLGEPPPR